MIPGVLFAIFSVIRRSIRKKSNSKLKEYVEYVADAIYYRVGRFFYRRMALAVSLRRYMTLQLGRTETRYLRVPGGEPLEVDQVFVPLNLSLADKRVDDSSLLEYAAATGGRIRIIGDPGSGKSSLVKKLFRETCRDAGRFHHSNQRTLPILVELKTLSPPADCGSKEALGEWLFDHLRQTVAKTEGFDSSGLFDVFSTDSLTIFLDGLDEVSTEDYVKVAGAINSLGEMLSQRSDSSVVVLTMRSQFSALVQSDFDETFPILATLTPFTPGDIFEFLSRYFKPLEKAQEVSRVYSDLTDRPTLREMCRNPLVLSMYVASDQSPASGGVPDSRSTFYNQVADELLVVRRSRQLGTTARTTLREQRESILGNLALENLLNPAQPANTVRYEDLSRLVSETYQLTDPKEADVRILELIRDTGLISIERDYETVRFTHLTFCEFFAAKEAVEGRANGWANLRSHYLEMRGKGIGASRLVEVLPFAVALMPRIQRSEALDDLRRLAEPRLIARALLETQLYSHQVLRLYLDNELRDLSDAHPDKWGDEWRERLHLFLVLLDDARSTLPDGHGLPGHEFVTKRLTSGSRDRMFRIFSTYAEYDPAMAFRLADSFGVDLSTEAPSLVIMNVSNPAFLGMLLKRTSIGSMNIERLALVMTSAALDQPIAAFRMVSHQPHEAFTRALDGRSTGWRYMNNVWASLNNDDASSGPFRSLLPLGRESLYTQCIAIAMEMNGMPGDMTPEMGRRIRALRAVKLPDRFIFKGSQGSFAALALVVVAVFGTAGLLPNVPVWFFAPIWLLIGYVGISSSFFRYRDYLYLQVMNLAPIWNIVQSRPARIQRISMAPVRFFYRDAVRYAEDVEEYRLQALEKSEANSVD